MLGKKGMINVVIVCAVKAASAKKQRFHDIFHFAQTQLQRRKLSKICNIFFVDHEIFYKNIQRALFYLLWSSNYSIYKDLTLPTHPNQNVSFAVYVPGGVCLFNFYLH